MNDKVSGIKIKQRIMLKKTEFKCFFFDGYSTTEYKNEKVAKEVFKKMQENKQKVELHGNIITEYRKGKTAQEIFDLYMRDIEKGIEQAKKSKGLIKIKYELIE